MSTCLFHCRTWMPKTRMRTQWTNWKDRKLCLVVFAKATIGPPGVLTRTPWAPCRRSWLNSLDSPLQTRRSLLALVPSVFQCNYQILISFLYYPLWLAGLEVITGVVCFFFYSLWPAEPEPAQPAQSKTGKYVPPSLRDGGTRRGESMQPNRRGGFKSSYLFAILNLGHCIAAWA